MSAKILARFYKKGDMRFISHLDLVRLFQRACRRADIPVALTKGFNPHLRISIKRALKLGVESENEEALFFLEPDIGAMEFLERINRELPEGIKIKDAKTDSD